MTPNRGYTLTAVGFAPYLPKTGKPNLSVVNGFWVASCQFSAEIGVDAKSAFQGLMTVKSNVVGQ